jgi:hypothetical protein
MASAEAGGPVAGAVDAAPIHVEVAFAAAPHQIDRVALCLPAGSTALQALRASGLADRLGAAVLDGLTLGLWGRAVEPGAVLRDRDRLELLRPLVVDPKEARRQRYRRDGLKKPRKTGPR